MRLEKWKERKIGEGVIVIYGKRESIKIIELVVKWGKRINIS